MKRFKLIFEYVFLFCVNGIMLWYFRGYLNLLIAVGMVLFLLYAVISVHIVKRYLSLSIDIPAEQMPKNTVFLVKVKVRNQSVFPLVTCRIRMRTGNVFLGETAEHDMVVPVKPLDVTEIEYPLSSSYVGNVEIMAEKLILEDLLALHSVKAEVSVSKNVYIVPRGETEEEFSLNAFEKGMNEVEESNLRGSDFSDVSQIREYIPGDAMKNIHWKLSAKKDMWMVKERLQMSSRKLLVLLKLDKMPETEMSNTSQTFGADIDRTMERLYAFGCFLIKNNVPVTLYWWSDKYSEIRCETAESADVWLQVMLHVFHTEAGSGFAEEQFRSLHPGQGYVLACQDGLIVNE